MGLCHGAVRAFGSSGACVRRTDEFAETFEKVRLDAISSTVLRRRAVHTTTASAGYLLPLGSLR